MSRRAAEISRRLRARLADERGVALVVAIGTLSLLLTLTGLTTAGAIQLTGASNKDRNAKRAFAATEAGLLTATYRLNNLMPPDADCVTDAVQPPDSSGGCTWEEDLGNGVRVRYHMTPVLTTGAKCAGFLVSYDPNNPGTSVAPRCITATGVVGDDKRRAQARVAAFKGTPVFPLGGILGFEGVDLKNNADLRPGSVGSNGCVRIENNAYVSGGVHVGPAGCLEVNGSLTTDGSPQLTRRTPEEGGFVPSPVEIGNSATVNDNGNWTFSSKAKYTWNATTRELDMDTGSITLLGGTYNLCQLTFRNNVDVFLAPGARVRLFIDDPDRTDSGCAPGTGNLIGNNQVTFHNPGAPEDFQIYVYGDGQVEFKNKATIKGVIYAPQANLVFKNNATIVGAVAARRVEFLNQLSLEWISTVSSLRATTTALYYRTAWRECSAEPPDPSDPSSGC